MNASIGKSIIYLEQAMKGGGPGVGTALLVGRSRDQSPVATGDFVRSYRRNHLPWGRLSL
jgi:hypothetical protein